MSATLQLLRGDDLVCSINTKIVRVARARFEFVTCGASQIRFDLLVSKCSFKTILTTVSYYQFLECCQAVPTSKQ